MAASECCFEESGVVIVCFTQLTQLTLVIDGQSNDREKKIARNNSNNAPTHTNKWEWRVSGPGAFSDNFL
jgi:hypothetical protein